ncbi:conserved exported hypothetical protein [Treponema phagedenis]|uniref:Uncharacterized protein n=1 Tax=Treponema phagedenis TaxID=162 RepID=A0A0B7GUF5_TREPH|nr:conserved exported hypothetical protein [Treponema phagedenis]
MKRLFFCLLVCFCFPAAAHEAEYTISETELTQLEMICQNLETSKQAQQLLIQSLREKLNKAASLQASLKNQLQTERETLQSLKKSYSAYESEAQKRVNELTIDNHSKALKIEKQRKTITELFSVVAIMAGAIAVMVFLKVKRGWRF